MRNQSKELKTGTEANYLESAWSIRDLLYRSLPVVRLDHGSDVTVLENRASVLPCSAHGSTWLGNNEQNAG